MIIDLHDYKNKEYSRTIGQDVADCDKIHPRAFIASIPASSYNIKLQHIHVPDCEAAPKRKCGRLSRSTEMRK